ncbi:MAG TPA: hypothetical protein ENN80_11765, partial [Candidatus Hydrogenedentes bacterium]|nr:hypothetical protein [Candidatus Hydrogenedentota bacterium]
MRTTRVAWRLSGALAGVVSMGGVLAAFLLIVFLLDVLFVLSPWARWACLTAGLATTSYVAWRHLLSSVPLFASDERVAAHLEAHVPDLDNAAINAVQLAKNVSDGESLDLVAQYLSSVAQRLRRHSGWEAFDTAGLWSGAKRAFGPLAAMAVCAGLFPEPLADSMNRLLHPSTTTSRAGGIRMEVSPGDAVVVVGGTFDVHVSIEGGEAESLALEREEASSVTPLEQPMRPAGEGRYAATLHDVQAPFNYRIAAVPAKGSSGHVHGLLRRVGERRAMSKTYHVRTAPPPEVETLALRYAYPAYTGLADKIEDPSSGDVRAVVGTEVALEGTSTKPLARADLDFGDTTQGAALSARTFRAGFTVREPGVYRICLEDEAGFTNVKPITHAIVPLPDRPPKVTLISPDEDVTIPA